MLTLKLGTSVASEKTLPKVKSCDNAASPKIMASNMPSTKEMSTNTSVYIQYSLREERPAKSLHLLNTVINSFTSGAPDWFLISH